MLGVTARGRRIGLRLGRGMMRGVRIAYLGPEGTNSHEAARRRHPGATLVALPDLPAVVDAAARGKVDEAIVPIENSTEGGVTTTLALLTDETAAPSIVGELVLPIRHHLVAPPGMRTGDIRRILSLPVATAQCRRHLAALVPGAELVPALSTAAAAAGCATEPATAAIASAAAAELHGLDIVIADIQDEPSNATRFVALGHVPPAWTGCDRTSIVFRFGADRAGSLVGALHPFSDRGINMTRIESRPTGEGLGRYLFLVDCEGHVTDGPVADALAAVSTVTDGLRILGSYPRAAD